MLIIVLLGMKGEGRTEKNRRNFAVYKLAFPNIVHSIK